MLFYSFKFLFFFVAVWGVVRLLKVCGIACTLAEVAPLLEYLDLNAAHEHNCELFRDPIHLNRRGQAAFTQAVIAKWHHEIDGN